MPLYQPIFNSSLYITFVLLFFVAIGGFIYNFHKSKLNILSTIYTPESVRNFNAPVPNTSLTAVIMAVFAVIGYASLLLYITRWEQSLVNLELCLAVSVLFFTVKIPFVALFFNTFYGKRSNGFISRYYKHTVLFGNLCIVGVMMLSYTLSTSTSTVWIITSIISILYCISISYIFISTFFENRGSFLRLFLYLCTLEILPVPVLVKVLS